MVESVAATARLKDDKGRKDREEAKKNEKKPKGDYKKLPRAEREKLINQYTAEMKKAAKLLDFEHAAFLRDKIKEIRGD